MKINIQAKTLQDLNKFRTKRLNWMNTWNKLETTIKHIITAGNRKSFWCDSHPWLCSCCSRLRFRIITGKYSPRLILNTRHGQYEYYNSFKLENWRSYTYQYKSTDTAPELQF